MRNHKISLEAEHWTPSEWNVKDGNTDVFVRFDDGQEWVATFFTYTNIASLSAKNQRTGECLSGKYFWASDMFLINEISRERIEEVVRHLLEENETDFASIFVQVESE